MHMVDGKNPAPLRGTKMYYLDKATFLYPMGGAGFFPSTVCDLGKCCCKTSLPTPIRTGSVHAALEAAMKMGMATSDSKELGSLRVQGLGLGIVP